MPASVPARVRANPFLAPDLSHLRDERVPRRAAGPVGPHGPAVPRLRAGRRRRIGVDGAPADAVHRPVLAARAGADAAPDPDDRVGSRRAPDVPARRRARTGQDRAVGHRRVGGERLPHARRRPQRREDQLGPRGRAMDAAPPGDGDPRRRRRRRRLRGHLRRQLHRPRPAPVVAVDVRVPVDGRRRGALHQEPHVAAFPARAGPVAADPRQHAGRRPVAPRPHRYPAHQRRRGLQRHLAVPRLGQGRPARPRADAPARGHRSHPGRPRASTRRHAVP